LAESDYSDQLTTTGKRSTFRYRWLGPTLPTEEYDTAAEAAERADKEAALETKDAALLGQYGLGLSVNGHRQLSVGDTPLRLDEHAVATVIALARRGGRATFRELEKEPALSKLAPRRIVEKLTDSLARIEPTMQANGIHFRNLRIPAGGNKVIRSIALGDYEQTQKLAVGSGEKESTAKIPARERRELRLAKFMQWATDVVEMAPDWSLSAACRGQDIKKYFVPGAASNSKDAKKDCQRCPVSVQCLASALINEEERGVFGGLTDRERKAVLNRVMSYGVRMGLDKIIQYQGGLKADGYRHAAARQETAEATI
jgi:WhiB family redox-sensing transcriptional regulator